MAAKHDWAWKRVGKKYWVVCAECGTSDRAFDTEEEANVRVLHLKVLGLKPSKLNRLFPKRLF